MRVHSLLFAASGLLTVSGTIQVAAQTIPQTTEVISVNDPRPVAMALEALEKKHGLAITYEDPKYTHPSEVQDVTALVRRDGRSFPRVIGPRGGALEFKYLATNGKPQEQPLALIRRMLTEYAALGGPVFDIQERVTEGLETQWHVIPARVRNNQGDFVASVALLDNRISIPPEKRSAIHTLSLVCDELTRISGHHVVLGIVPQNYLYAHRLEMGATDEPARDVLAALFKQLHIGMVWQLFYDPGMGSYALNMHLVARAPSAGATTGTPTSPPGTSAAQPRHRCHIPASILHRLYQQPLRPERISEIQSALARGGYYLAELNGNWDSNTVAALQKFQAAQRLAPTGTLDLVTLVRLQPGSDSTCGF